MTNKMTDEQIAQHRRKMEIIAGMIEQAKTLLTDAKHLADEHGIYFDLTDMLNEVDANQSWYASDTSHC